MSYWTPWYEPKEFTWRITREGIIERVTEDANQLPPLTQGLTAATARRVGAIVGFHPWNNEGRVSAVPSNVIHSDASALKTAWWHSWCDETWFTGWTPGAAPVEPDVNPAPTPAQRTEDAGSFMVGWDYRYSTSLSSNAVEFDNNWVHMDLNYSPERHPSHDIGVVPDDTLGWEFEEGYTHPEFIDAYVVGFNSTLHPQNSSGNAQAVYMFAHQWNDADQAAEDEAPCWYWPGQEDATGKALLGAPGNVLANDIGVPSNRVVGPLTSNADGHLDVPVTWLNRLPAAGPSGGRLSFAWLHDQLYPSPTGTVKASAPASGTAPQLFYSYLTWPEFYFTIRGPAFRLLLPDAPSTVVPRQRLYPSDNPYASSARRIYPPPKAQQINPRKQGGYW